MKLLTKGSLVRQRILLLGGDALAGLAILFPQLTQGPLPPRSLCFIPAVLLFSFLCEVYVPDRRSLKERVLRSLLSVVLSLIVLGFIPGDGHPFFQTLVAALGFFLVQTLWQALYHKSNNALFFAEKLLVIGTGEFALNVEHLIADSPGKYELAGYIRPPMDPVTVPEEKILGDLDQIVDIARITQARAIVIALTERRGNLTAAKLVTCKLMGVRILDYPSLYELMTGKIPVEHINPSWLVQSSGFLITPFIRTLKKILDLFFSSLLLLICLPFFPLVALMIKLDSPGPVFYFQKRVGLNGKPFTIYKFRSMAMDSEKGTGASWASEDDPRITKFGAFMRKARIDELPQLFNVLKGDMSFIGPRPERPEFVAQISKVTPYYEERHAIKPGITGWAQVMYPYGASLGDSVEKLRYDLYYINNLSMFLELLIVFETIKIVLFRRGGR